MGATTFSGPIKAGTEREDNIGYVVMAQTSAVTQASGSTTITIPANSQITAITVFVDAIWDGVAATFGVGFVGDATALTAAGGETGGVLGLVTVDPGADATRVGNWVDIGTTDKDILVTSTNTGAGTGYITVEYIQNINLA